MNEFDAMSNAIRAHDVTRAEHLLAPATAPNLKIYAGQYLESLCEALGRTYPVTHELLGENNFRYFARRYILAHPPRAASIDHFGDRFPEQLAEEEDLVRSQPNLIHFAKLDWFHHHPLAPETLELELPASLADAYVTVQRTGRLVTTEFGPPRRHRLMRTET